MSEQAITHRYAGFQRDTEPESVRPSRRVLAGPRSIRRLGRSTAKIAALSALAAGAAVFPTASPAEAAERSFTSINVTADGQGYKITSTAGESYDFGTGTPQRNPAGFTGRITDVATTADGRGTLALSSSGQFYASGTARAWTNPTGFSGEMVALAMTADGQGAVAASSAGQLYAFGTARPQPNPVGFSGRVVDVSLTADGQGLLAVSSAGQFYAYGTARPQPNPVGFSKEILAADLTADGQGLMAVSGAGQLYAYGTARPQPNPTGFSGNVVDVDLTANGLGAIAVSSSGQAYAYGTVTYRGNADPGSSSLGVGIARLARQQSFTEVNRNNCNPYSFYVGSGGTSCPAGQRSQEWCADFVKTMWARSGAATSGLSPAASSFRATNGVTFPGFRSGATNNPMVGDAVVWGGTGHVGIVVAVQSSSWIEVTSGNIGHRVTTEWIDPRSKSYNGGGVVGYTSPRPRA